MRKMATGIWNSIKDRTKAEYGLIKDEWSGVAAADRAGIEMNMQTQAARGLDVSTLSGMQPTLGLAALSTFISAGSAKAAGIGALGGAAYGAVSDNTSVVGGAMKGAALGYGLKSMQGIIGERKTMANNAWAEVNRLKSL